MGNLLGKHSSAFNSNKSPDSLANNLSGVDKVIKDGGVHGLQSPGPRNSGKTKIDSFQELFVRVKYSQQDQLRMIIKRFRSSDSCKHHSV